MAPFVSWYFLLSQCLCVCVCVCECMRPGFESRVGKIPWRRKWQPTPVFLPGESHGGRSLVGYSLRGRKESDMTELLHSLTHVSLFFKVFIGFATTLPLFHVLLFWLWGMWDLSSPARDWTRAPYIQRRSLTHGMAREVPSQCFLKFPDELMDGIWFTLVLRKLLLLLQCSCFFCPSWGRGISYTDPGKKAQAFLWPSVAACFYRT